MESEASIRAAERACGRWVGRNLWLALVLATQALWCSAAEWGMQVRDAPAGNGAELIAVVPQGPAAVAGLRAGDIIIHCEDFLVRSATELANILRLAGAKDVLSLRVSRDGWEKLVVLSARPVPPPQVAPPPPPKPWFGLQVSDTSPPGPGATVTTVPPNGPAAQAGLRPGDLITQADGRPLAGAGELAALTAGWPIGRPLRLTVVREGWLREMSLTPIAALPAQDAPAQRLPTPPAPPTVPAVPAPPPAGAATPYPSALGAQFSASAANPATATPLPTARVGEPVAAGTGSKTVVVVGDFQVKAATASTAIGQGLREMLVTSLFNSGRFIVVERGEIALPQIAGERELSRSSLARPGEAIPEGQMDVADIMIYGAVTEFELEASGTSFQIGVSKLPLGIGRDTGTAHMAIDVRLVDVVTGRVLGAQRIIGEATGGQNRIEVAPTVRGFAIPVSLASYKNTPMEEAIRACMDKAVGYVANSVPRNYFHHP